MEKKKKKKKLFFCFFFVNEMGKDFFEHRIYSAVIIELRDSEGLGVFWYQSELTLPLAC